MPDLEDLADFPAAASALRTAWNTVRQALHGDRAAVTAVTSSQDLVQLLLRIRDAEDLVHRMEMDRRARMERTVREALLQFRGVASVDELSSCCPRVAHLVGLDRLMFSTVENSTWTPRSAYDANNPEWADAIVHSGQDQPQQLVSSLPEFDLLRRNEGILVTEVPQNERVYKAITEPALCTSYVASAIMPAGRLIGFLHADQYYHCGNVREIDRDLLALFAEGFGFALERALLIDRAATLHEELVRGATDTFRELMGEYSARVGSELARAPEQQNAANSGRLVAQEYGLTRRELDVLRLMAEGCNNARIAQRLVISAGTVKSHVKHILRKLRVASRAEAISLWFTMPKGP